ncbi:MAG: hypothetical protein AB8G96_14925 [Phycisphaerales bacterium]
MAIGIDAGQSPESGEAPNALRAGMLTAVSECGRFVVFDADTPDPPPDQAPFDAWLEASEATKSAMGWSMPAGAAAVAGGRSKPAARRRRFRPTPGVRVEVLIGSGEASASGAAAGEPPNVVPVMQGRVHLATGRACIAGIDEAFAARNAELHPGAFGDVIELRPGDYAVEVERLDWPADVRRRLSEAVREQWARRGDAVIAGTVYRGVPLLVIVGLAVAAGLVMWLVDGGLAARIGGIGRLVHGLIVVAAGLAAWAGLVRGGGFRALTRYSELQAAMRDACPDLRVRLRRIRSAGADVATDLADKVRASGDDDAADPADPADAAARG